MVLVKESVRDLSQVHEALKQAKAQAQVDFVLLAGENEGYYMTPEAAAKQDERALLLEVKDDPRMSNGLVKAALMLILFRDDLPSFIQKQTTKDSQGRLVIRYKYLPQIAPVEWAVWIRATQEAVKAAGTSA